jgi:iron transport multicopper oxidase
LSSGLAVVFIEAPEKLQQNPKAPQVLYDQCDYWGLPTSGNVVGKNSTIDFEGQAWGPFPLVMVCSSSSSLFPPLSPLAQLSIWAQTPFHSFQTHATAPVPSSANDQNWTPKAIITMIACIITALIGFLTVIWYGSGDLDEAEIEDEVRRKMEAKKVKQDRVRRLVGI